MALSFPLYCASALCAWNSMPLGEVLEFAWQSQFLVLLMMLYLLGDPLFIPVVQLLFSLTFSL